MCPVKTYLSRKIKMRQVKTRKVLRYKRGVTRSLKSKKDRQIIKTQISNLVRTSLKNSLEQIQWYVLKDQILNYSIISQ